MKSCFLKYLYGFLFIIISLMGFNSCSDDDPIAPEEEHFDAEGLIITESGITIASIFRGVTTDTLEIPAGGRSGHFKVKFYDENKNVIDPPTDGKTLGWEIGDTSKLGVYQHPGEEGEYELHLDGKNSGNTYIEFFVLHEGHSDFRSGKIPVDVKDISGSHGELIGVILYDEESGDTLATLNSLTSTVTGSLEIAAGDTTDHIEVVFFDSNGVEFQPPTPEHSITIVTADPTKTLITGLEADEPFAFKVFGIATGSTTISISLLDEGTVEYTFSGIPVNVQ